MSREQEMRMRNPESREGEAHPRPHMLGLVAGAISACGASRRRQRGARHNLSPGRESWVTCLVQSRVPWGRHRFRSAAL